MASKTSQYVKFAAFVAVIVLAVWGFASLEASYHAPSPTKPAPTEQHKSDAEVDKYTDEDEVGFNCKTMGNKSGCEGATTDLDGDGKTGNDDPYLNDPTR